MDLTPLLEARSVALVGASPKRGSVGQQAEDQLLRGGFEGELIRVNPSYPEMAASLYRSVDLAVLAVANRHLAQAAERALAAGVRSVAIFASCHGTGPDGQPLQTWLAERLGSIPVCGGNGMGFVNLDRSLRICGFFQPLDLTPGPISFISHSGSLFSAMLHNQRQLRFNLVVSTGNELTTTAGDFLGFAVAQPTTRVVGMFLETVRNRQALAASWRRAADADIPVVVLKVGRSARGAAAVATHTAGLAGAYEPFAAFARAHGVHLVDTMEEMADTLALFSSPRRATAPGLGVVHDSGGERTLLLDQADVIGVELATVSAATRQRLSEILDEGLEPANPVDAWGTGRDANRVVSDALEALSADEGVGAIALAVDFTAEENGLGYVPELVALNDRLDLPVVALTNLSSAVDQRQADLLDRAGIPLLRGIDSGLAALGHLLHHQARRPLPPVPVDPAWDGWRGRLRTIPVDEIAGMELLEFAGIDTAPLTPCETIEEALASAETVGYPVALKVLGLDHKTEAGGLRLNLIDDGALAQAWSELIELRLPLAVQKMTESGVEVALGLVNDAQVGPVVMVAAGGVAIELLGDKALAVPPVGLQVADRLLARLRIDRLLTGFRGEKPLAGIDLSKPSWPSPTLYLR